MDLRQFTKALTPEIIERFKRAIETGKWLDGKRLSTEQRETCMQALIAYEYLHLKETERSGYVPPKDTPCGDQGEKPIKWEQPDKL